MKPCKKIKYPTESLAMESLGKIQSADNTKKKPVRAYRCFCGAWHLTSRREIKDIESENERLKQKIADLTKRLHKQNGEYVKMLGKHYEDQQVMNSKICPICSSFIGEDK